MVIRVAFITTIVSPYRIPFLNYLHHDREIELKVFYVAEQEKDRLWKTYYDEIKYPFEILKGFHIYTKKRTFHLNFGMIPKLIRYRPNIIILGTDILSTPMSWAVLAFAKSAGIKVIRYESQNKYSGTSSRLKRWLYRIYYSFVDHFFAYSILTEEYLTSSGIEPSRITVGFNVGDTDFFCRKTNEFIKSELYLEERSKYPEVLMLFSGRLIESKNILKLLMVLKGMDYADIGLFILGDGELREETRKMSREFRNLRIYHEGFRQKEECIRFFGLSDIFVFPTLLDRASIVLSEALVSGLFVIGSKYDGSSANLIKEGQNGFVIDPNDQDDFRRALESAYAMKKEGLISKDEIKATMDGFTVDKYAARLVELIKCIY